MANAPQKVTRQAPPRIPAPPARAAVPPSKAKNPSEVTGTQMLKALTGAKAVTAKGSAAPTAKLAADAMEAWIGLASKAAEMPSSSRTCAPNASCYIS